MSAMKIKVIKNFPLKPVKLQKRSLVSKIDTYHTEFLSLEGEVK
jgi:hypothetical protein